MKCLFLCILIIYDIICKLSFACWGFDICVQMLGSALARVSPMLGHNKAAGTMIAVLHYIQ